MTVDRDGKILSINRAVKGLDAEGMIGTNLGEYESPDYRHVREKALEKVFRTGEYVTYEILGMGSEGKYNTWYETRILPVEYEEQNETLILMSRDITDRKKAEKELKEKLVELEKFQDITVDRELEMIKLKKEINSLCEKYGEKPKYKIDQEGEMEKEISI